MNTMDTIYTRRSTRRFLDKPVDKATVEKLINAALQAPSAMNTQPWAFGVIQSSSQLKDISNRAKAFMLSNLDKMPMLEKYREAFENPDFNIFYNASTVISIIAKPNLSPNPTTDCALAAENLMLAARDFGLGTCWIGFAQIYLNQPEAKLALGIPEDHIVVAPIIVGYPEAELSTMEKDPPEMLFWKE